MALSMARLSEIKQCEMLLRTVNFERREDSLALHIVYCDDHLSLQDNTDLHDRQH